MPQKLFFPLFFLLFFLLSIGFVNAQVKPDLKTTEETEKLRKAAVVFLRETMGDVGSMRSLENRLSFGAELASLMWLHDEKEARGMYLSVTSDFKQLLMGFDTKLNNLAASADDNEEDSSGGFLAEATSKQELQRKVRKALEMRQQIALSLAEHEADLALSFYYDSLAGLTSAEFRGTGANERDSHFEIQLMTQVAETNAAKAAQFGAKSLDKGVTYQHLELLKKIYAKDAEKGIEFAGAMVSRFKASKAENSETWVIYSFISYGEETTDKKIAGGNEPVKKPVLTKQEMRDLAEVLAQTILAGDEDSDMGNGYIVLIEKYAPSRAAQLRARSRNRAGSSNSMSVGLNTMSSASNTNSVAIGARPELDRRAKALEERLAIEKKTMDDVQSLGTDKGLAKDEREKIIAQARKIIAQTPGRERKIVGLSLLAGQVAMAGDKELAATLMKEAESFASPQPKNYQDFMLTWLLISGYSEVDTDKAFPMLTETILRLNDTIAALIKGAEFIDTHGDMIADGEVQINQFGGSMLRSLTKELKIAEPTLRNLAKADFAKTKAVTNTFERAEVRVLAKMMVLRTILSENKFASDDRNIGLVLN